MRYFFNAPTTWAVNISEYLLLYSTFLSVGWLLRKGEHIQVTFLIEHVGPGTNLVLKILQSLLGIGACIFVFLSSIEATWDAIARNILIIKPLVIHKYMVLWIIPLGFLMALIYFIQQGIKALASLAVSMQEKDKSQKTIIT
jgi:TRAP-type C4-dicarboxylate transport system permease small subunit